MMQGPVISIISKFLLYLRYSSFVLFCLVEL